MRWSGRITRPGALALVVWLSGCGGKTAVGDGDSRTTEGAPGQRPDATGTPGEPLPDDASEPPPGGVFEPPPGGVFEPPPPSPPGPVTPPRDTDPLARLRERCTEICQRPEALCQVPFGDDPASCTDSCLTTGSLSGDAGCVDLFLEMTFCMEEISIESGCSDDFSGLFAVRCQPLLLAFLGECGGSSANPFPPPSPPPDLLACGAGDEYAEPGACGASRFECPDVRTYEIQCRDAGPEAVECTCYIDGRVLTSFGVDSPPGEIVLQDFCFSPRGFDACGFPVLW